MLVCAGLLGPEPSYALPIVSIIDLPIWVSSR